MTLIKRSNIISDLMRFYKQDILCKVKRKNIWREHYGNFPSKMHFAAYSADRMGQGFFHTHYWLSLILMLGCSVGLVFLFLHLYQTYMLCVYSILFPFFPLSQCLTFYVSYVYSSSRHVEPLKYIYLPQIYLFTTLMWNSFMILIYSGSCVQQNDNVWGSVFASR